MYTDVVVKVYPCTHGLRVVIGSPVKHSLLTVVNLGIAESRDVSGLILLLLSVVQRQNNTYIIYGVFLLK